MVNALENPDDDELWLDALNAKFEGGQSFGRREWDQLLGHCQVFTAILPGLPSHELT